MLTKKKKTFYRDLLTQRLEGLLEDANKTVSDMTDHRENFPDPTDRATMALEYRICATKPISIPYTSPRMNPIASSLITTDPKSLK